MKGNKCSIGIYIPSYGRQDEVTILLNDIADQIANLDSQFKSEFQFVVILSVNHDINYQRASLEGLVDEFILLPANFGADVNIALGFGQALSREWDYLWVVGDDEPLGSEALTLICSQIRLNKPDLIVGSKRYLGIAHNPQSFHKLNKLSGGTITFITSTIYRVNWSDEIVTRAIEYAFTSYSHVTVISQLICMDRIKTVALVEMQQLCDYHFKVQRDPLKPRKDYGYRDSRVFFGKVLASLATESPAYIKRELTYWWCEHWHRVSMYMCEADFRGALVRSEGIKHMKLVPLVLLSFLPFWRIKELIKPVPLKRQQEQWE